MTFKSCVNNPTEIGTMNSVFSYVLCKNHESFITVGERSHKFCPGNGNSLVHFSISPTLNCLLIRFPEAFLYFTSVVLIIITVTTNQFY